MKRLKIAVGLLAEVLGVGTSAFSVQKTSRALELKYYWYTNDGIAAGFITGPSSVWQEEARLDEQNGGAYVTVYTSGDVWVEVGYIDGGPGVRGPGSGDRMYRVPQ